MGVDTASDVLRRNPITGIVGRCACATSGHDAADPAIPVMKSRRRIGPFPTPCLAFNFDHQNTKGHREKQGDRAAMCDAEIPSRLCLRWVRTGKSRREQMFSGLPPKADRRTALMRWSAAHKPSGLDRLEDGALPTNRV